jgi:hypothetical protein
VLAPGSEAVVAVGVLEVAAEADELVLGDELLDGGADEVVDGDDSPLPEEEPELPAEEPELPAEEPELPAEEPEPLDELEPPELPDEEPEPDPPSGLTYWLSPAEAPPPPEAIPTAGEARARSPRTARQSSNWRHAVIAVSMSSDDHARASRRFHDIAAGAAALSPHPSQIRVLQDLLQD